MAINICYFSEWCICHRVPLWTNDQAATETVGKIFEEPGQSVGKGCHRGALPRCREPARWHPPGSGPEHQGVHDREWRWDPPQVIYKFFRYLYMQLNKSHFSTHNDIILLMIEYVLGCNTPLWREKTPKWIFIFICSTLIPWYFQMSQSVLYSSGF